MNNISIIEAAYLSGFEPSTETLTEAEIYEEAIQFLTETF